MPAILSPAVLDDSVQIVSRYVTGTSGDRSNRKPIPENKKKGIIIGVTLGIAALAAIYAVIYFVRRRSYRNGKSEVRPTKTPKLLRKMFRIKEEKKQEPAPPNFEEVVRAPEYAEFDPAQTDKSVKNRFDLENQNKGQDQDIEKNVARREIESSSETTLTEDPNPEERMKETDEGGKARQDMDGDMQKLHATNDEEILQSASDTTLQERPYSMVREAELAIEKEEGKRGNHQ